MSLLMRSVFMLALGAIVFVLIGCGGSGIFDELKIVRDQYGAAYSGRNANGDVVWAIAPGSDASSARNTALNACIQLGGRDCSPVGEEYFQNFCVAVARGDGGVAFRGSATRIPAENSALEACRYSWSSSCRLAGSVCYGTAADGGPSGILTSAPTQNPTPTPALPPEPSRSSPPQGPGSDLPGMEVAGAGTTAYVSALNNSSRSVTYRAGTWFEPKDGRYQRMIVTRSTTVSPGRVVEIPTACMQRGNPAPASGARFFSRPKSVSDAVQQCQSNCLSGDQDIQTCVWRCERSTEPPPSPTQRYYGAIAAGWAGVSCRDGVSIGFARNASTEDFAHSGAIQQCRENGGNDCTVMQEFGSAYRGNSQCGALVYGSRSGACGVRVGTGDSLSAAESDALRDCRNGGFSSCRLEVSLCTE